jgi:Fe-S oxidoreductase
MEEEPDQRVNQLRMKDAVATQADIVITACPFCLQMFEDAAGALEMEKPLEVLDLVELLERAVKLPVTPIEPTTPLEVDTVTSDRPLTVVGRG